jgi:hypothetical protein
VNAAHAREHEALIRAVIVGDRSRADGEVRAVLDSCPACARALEELGELSRSLDELRGAEREALAGAAPASAAPWPAARVAAALQGARASERTAAGRLVWVGLAAAAIVAFVLAVRDGRPSGELRRGTQEPQPESYLGARRIEGLAPRGEVEDYGTFRWTVAPEVAGASTFVVRVRGGDADSAFSLESERLRGNEWTPTKEELASMPDSIRWEVTAFDASGSLLDSDVQRASRSLR